MKRSLAHVPRALWLSWLVEGIRWIPWLAGGVALLMSGCQR